MGRGTTCVCDVKAMGKGHDLCLRCEGNGKGHDLCLRCESNGKGHDFQSCHFKTLNFHGLQPLMYSCQRPNVKTKTEFFL
jgi:hypothetical protein